jgi:predicted nucleotidyltransferase
MEQSLLDNRIHLDVLRNTLAKHQVEKAYLFGSILTQKFDNQSDIDILVRFRDNLSPLEKGDLWWSLHDTIRDLYQREIDIVTENSLKNPYFINELNRTKKLVYHSK